MRIRTNAVIVVLITLMSVFAGRSHAQSSIQTVTTPLQGSFFWANAGADSFYDKVVQDSCGDIYALSDDGDAVLYPTAWSLNNSTIVHLTSYGARWSTGLMGGIALDASNNLYVTDPTDHQITEIAGTGSCGPQVAPSSTTALFTMTELGLSSNYNAGDIVVDAAGDIFAYFSNGSIYERTAAGSYIQVAASVSGTITQMSVDAAGSLYYANGSGIIYKIDTPASASSPYALVTGLASVYGLTFGSNGDLFLEDTNNHGFGSTGEVSWPDADTTIYKVPYLNGTLQVGDVFPVATGLTGYMELTTASDGKTLIYTDDAWEYYGILPGPINMGSLATGNTSTAQLVIQFNASATPETIAVYGPSGVFTQTTAITYESWWPAKMPVCTTGTTYAAGSHCTVSLQFAPTTFGAASGSVVLLDSNGAQLATAALYGTGKAAAIAVDPGTVSSLGSGYTNPQGVAFDHSGNMFIADSGANTIWEIASGSTSATALATGFSTPKGVAVDSAGNVYVADTGNDRIVEIPVVSGALSASAMTTFISSSDALQGATLNAPMGIAIDPRGSVYIADKGNGRVLYIPSIGSVNPSLALSISTSLSAPSAVVADATGNVYVADVTNGSVYEFTSSSTPTTVATGLSSPSGLALDASGSLFVVDAGNNKVWRIPNLSGTLTQASAVCVSCQQDSDGAAIIAAPSGVAVDASGSLYVTDSTNAATYAINRTASSLSAGTVAAGDVSAAMTYTIASAGTSALSLTDPYYVASGNTAEFTLLSSESSACTSSESIAAGAFCLVEAEYTPDSTASGNKAETLTISSDATNAASVTLSASGTTPETATVTTTTSLSMTSPSSTSVSYGVSEQFSVTVSATTTPTGIVDLYVDGSIAQSATLSSGTASFTLAEGALSYGSHKVYAYYEGSTSDKTSSSSTQTITVGSAATTTAVSYATAYTNPNSQPAGTALALTATVASTVTLQPTDGYVSFSIAVTDNGTTTTSTKNVALTSASQAVYSWTPTAPSVTGNYDSVVISATYVPASSNYAGSSSTNSTMYVSGSSGTTIATQTGSTLTSSSSAQSSITFTQVSYGGWSGTVSYVCDSGTLPAYAKCVFSPSSVSVLPSTSSSAQSQPTVTLTVTIDNASVTASSMTPWMAGFTGLILLLARRRMKHGLQGMMLMIGVGMMSIGILGMTACGANSTHVTPTGQSTVKVYAEADPYKTGSTSTVQTCSSSTDPCKVQVSTITLTVN